MIDPTSPGPASRRPRFRPVPFRFVAPNLITLLALCVGLSGIRMALEGKLEIAVDAVVLAAILDGLDGRVARLLKGTSRFGAELDSLADFMNFGVAPALIVYLAGLDALGSLGWVGALVFAIGSALRLARFNVMIDQPKEPGSAKFFMGVPAPAGAICVMLPIYLEMLGLPIAATAPHVVLVYVIAVAMLMVSRLPTFSGKELGRRVPRDLIAPLLIAVVAVIALVVSFPWHMLAGLSLLYLATLPLSFVARRRAAERELAAKAAAEPRPAAVLAVPDTLTAVPGDGGDEERPLRLN